jgi:hypothetical protein
MKKPPSFLPSSNQAVDAHQKLAVAVIRQALQDATDPCTATGIRAGARAFLAGSPMLQQWCCVAGLDPDLVLARRLKRES